MTEKKQAVEWTAIGQLLRWPGNPKDHPSDQIDALVASLDQFGWVRPIVVDEQKQVLAGNGMLEAAKARGNDVVPVIVKRGLSEEQKRAYVIADNRLSELGEWNAVNLFDQFDGLSEDLQSWVSSLGLEVLDLAETEPIAWEFSVVEDYSVITIKCPLPTQADVLERIKEMDGLTVEISNVQK